MRSAIVALLALLTLLTGCTAVVDGHGTPAGGVRTPDFPSSSSVPSDQPSSPAAIAGADFVCPQVTFPQAHMSFACVSDAMTVAVAADPVFPIAMAQTVEASTGWSLESAAQTYTGPATTFPAIAADVRNEMIVSGAYGDAPRVAVDSVRSSTVGGRSAYTVADTVTLDPAWAKANGTAVKIEKRWLVVVRYAPGTFVVWLATIPDLARQYWSRVPATIASIRLT